MCVFEESDYVLWSYKENVSCCGRVVDLNGLKCPNFEVGIDSKERQEGKLAREIWP